MVASVHDETGDAHVADQPLELLLAGVVLGQPDGRDQHPADQRPAHGEIFPRTTGQRAPVAVGTLLGWPKIVSFPSSA